MYKNSWRERNCSGFGFNFLSFCMDLKSNVDSTETSKKCCLNIIA